MRTLVILSNTFPDGAFIRTEVAHLNGFDKILYLPKPIGDYRTPVTLDSGSIKTHMTSDPWPNFGALSLMKKIKMLVSVIATKAFWSGLRDVVDFSKEEQRNNKFKMSFARLKEQISYQLAAIKYANEVKEYVAEQGVPLEEQVVFYAYRLHVHSLSITILKKWFPNSVLIARTHGYDLYEYRNPNGYIPNRRYTLKRLNRIYCISKHGQKYLQERYPEISDKITTSYLGVNDCGSQEWNSSNKLRILSCSRLSPEKRIPLFMGLFSKLSFPVQWTHIGDGEELDNYRRQAALISESDKEFRFLGYMDNSKVIEYYKNNPIDWFVNLSDNEGIPVTMMEALSFGVPVIGTKVGGVPEIIVSGQNGFLFDANSKVEDLAQAFSDISQISEDDYTVFRKGARSQFERCFSTAENTRVFMEDIIRMTNNE